MFDSKRDIESKRFTLEMLAEQPWYFNVPIYQRLYVWGADQIKTLLTDMANAFDRREEQFFLGGALLVEKTSDADRNSKLRCFDLIDGQQRFTTLWMLSTVPVWREVMEKYNHLGDGNTPRLHFSIRQQVNDYLASLMSNGKPVTDEAAATLGMREAQKWMATFAESHARPDGKPVDAAYLRDLAEFVYRKVELVLTGVPQGMDLNKLFEVINNRGVQLQHHEILKARLLRDIPATERARYGVMWNACADMSGFVERNLCQETQLPAHQLGDLYARGLLQEASAVHALLTQKLDETDGSGDQRQSLQAILDGTRPDADTASSSTDSADDSDEPWARSIVGFPLFLQHVLRIWLKDKEKQDLPRLLDRQLLGLFEPAFPETDPAAERTERAKGFIDLLWRIRVLWDEYVIKWVVDQSGEEIHQVCQTSLSTVENGRSHINRSRESTAHQGLSLLQSMLYHSQEITTHYWLTPFLHFVHRHADTLRGTGQQATRHYDFLCHLDNHLLGEATETPLVERTRAFMDEPWRKATSLTFENVLNGDHGVGFPHYWFYKLDFVLWYDRYRDDALWSNFRFTAKNSVEHISPQNPRETDTNPVSEEWLNRFGNLALVSRSINSEYGNRPFNEKYDRYHNNRNRDKRPESLKMDVIYADGTWGDERARDHQHAMLEALRRHYRRCFHNPG